MTSQSTSIPNELSITGKTQKIEDHQTTLQRYPGTTNFHVGAEQEPHHLSGVGVSGEVAGGGGGAEENKGRTRVPLLPAHSLAVRHAQTPSEADSGSCNWLEKAVIWGVICSKKLNKVE